LDVLGVLWFLVDVDLSFYSRPMKTSRNQICYDDTTACLV
jgi:hypothetical protein